MKLLQYTFLLLLTTTGAWAQQNTTVQKITGNIISAASHSPVPSATVSLKLQGTAVTTGQAGEFSINYNAQRDSLIITHVSYKRKAIAVSKLTTAPLTIVLEEAAAGLEEVLVNTGFQQLPKERATGSFSFIDNKTINLQTGTNILDRLNGVAGSVLFDNTKNKTANRQLHINIRGLATINGSQDPLIVLDNFPYEGDINSVCKKTPIF